jgi:hypothetical protein
MAIYRILQQSVFGPEETARMIEAYETAIRELDPSELSESNKRMIAKRIVQLVKTGEEEAPRISKLAIEGVAGQKSLTKIGIDPIPATPATSAVRKASKAETQSGL